MAASLFEHGAIRTTEAKAKELRRFVEKLITLARKGTLHARRMVIAELGHDRLIVDDKGEIQDKTLIRKLFDEIAPGYADRPGGYTRIIRLSERRIGDAGTQVILQLVQEGSTKAKAGGESTGRRRRRAAKRHEAAAGARPAEAPAPADEAEPEDQAEDVVDEAAASDEQPAAEDAVDATEEGAGDEADDEKKND